MSRTTPPTNAADDIGEAFVLQYFKIMKRRPDELHRFYSNDSRVSRGSPNTNGFVDFHHASGPARIRELLCKEHSCGVRLSVALISSLHSQDSVAGSVTVQINGTLKFVDNSSRDFSMSVFLVQQENASDCNYYVLNDILTFQQLQQEPEETCNGHFENTQALVADKSQQQRIYKPNVSQPQQERLTEPIDHVSRPIAPSARPAAAPLPTTTVPQLSGVPRTPSVKTLKNINDDASRTSTSPAASSKRDDASSAEVEYVELPGQEGKQMNDSKEVSPVEEMQSAAVKSVDSEAEKRRVCSNDCGGEGSWTSPVGQTGVTDTEETMHPTPDGTLPEKESAWKTKSASPVFSDIFAFPSPLDKTKDISGAASPKSTEVGPSPKAFQPVQPSPAVLNRACSYASKLLSVGRGGLRPPCQAGFAVPPLSEKPAEKKQQPRPDRSRPGKFLWLSLLPADMTDAQIGKAVSEQLKGQACEGHAVRIERVSGRHHGYIELDTDICARELLHKGLYLHGQRVIVDFPRKNATGRRGGGGQQRNGGNNGSDNDLKKYPSTEHQRRPYHGNNQRNNSNNNGGYHQQQHYSNNNNKEPANNKEPNNNGGVNLSQNSQDNNAGWILVSRNRKSRQGQKPKSPKINNDTKNQQKRGSQQQNGGGYNKRPSNNYENGARRQQRQQQHGG